MKRCWVVSGLGVMFLLTPAFTDDSTFLDGTACRVTMSPDATAAKNGAKEFTDRLRFANGKFSSEYFAAKAFQPAKYRGEREEKEAEFELEQTSETDGVVNWLGE